MLSAGLMHLSCERSRSDVRSFDGRFLLGQRHRRLPHRPHFTRVLFSVELVKGRAFG